MFGLSGYDLQDIFVVMGGVLFIIFFFGYVDILDSVWVMKFGVVDFLMKLVEDYVLIDVVWKVVEKDCIDCLMCVEVVLICKCLVMLMLCELEVFYYVIVGKLNKQIVVEFGMVEKIIKVYCVCVMEKMQVKLFVELVWFVVLVGIIL